MAGIGIRLNKIFNRQTVISSLFGIACSIGYTILPMLLVIGCLLLMYQILGFDTVSGVQRELFSCSVLYIFIFSVVFTSAFNSVLSKYMTDNVYMEKYENIRPCVYFGLATTVLLAMLFGIPFYLHEYFVGKVAAYYVFTSFAGFVSLTLVFCMMIFNSILKAYKQLSLYFGLGMLLTLVCAMVFRFVLHMSITYSMLLALTIGFILIAVLETGNVMKYFRANSYQYRPVLAYYRRYRWLIVANLFYTLGLFSHNFVFWFHPWQLEVVKTYICNEPYDMATCIAMFTNITATTFFIARIEMHFHESYSNYNNAVIGGKLDTINKAKQRMFRTLRNQLMALVRLQFSITVVVFLLANIFLPRLGLSGLVMQMYPLLAVGYFISFLFYSNLLFLYYFNDLSGAGMSSLLFCLVSVVGSVFAMRLPIVWYGAGFTTAALCAYTFSFFRLRWIERNFDYYTFCRGRIIGQGEGEMPPAKVYDRDEEQKNTKGGLSTCP